MVMYLMKLPLQTGYILLRESCSSRLLRVALVVLAIAAVIAIHYPCGAPTVHPPTRVDEVQIPTAGEVRGHQNPHEKQDPSADQNHVAIQPPKRPSLEQEVS